MYLLNKLAWMSRIFKKKEKKYNTQTNTGNEINLNEMGTGYSNLNQNDD